MTWIIIAVIVLILLAVLFYLALYFLRFVTFRKPSHTNLPDEVIGDDNPPHIKNKKQWFFDEQAKNYFEKVSITSFDSLTLRGFIIPTKTKSNKVVILFHGYTSSGILEYAAFMEFYNKNNINILIIDERAHGESEGKYISFGVFDRYDCKNWCEYAVEKFGKDCEIYLHGISMGCSTVLMASCLNLPKNVKGIVADCGYTTPFEQFAFTIRHDYHLTVFPIVYVADFLCGIIENWHFKDASALEAVKNTTIPILFVHGDADNFVSTDMGIRNYNACTSPKKLLLVPNAPHAISYYFGTDEYEKAVLELINTHFASSTEQ